MSEPIPPGNQPRRHSRRGPAARATGNARRIVRVARGPEGFVVVRDAEGKLVQVGLAEQDGAGVEEFLRDGRVPLRPVCLETRRAAGRRQIRGIDIVFDRERHAVEGAHGTARLPRLVCAPRRGPHRGRILRDEAVERRRHGASLEQRLGVSGRRHLAAAKRCPRLADRHFLQHHSSSAPHRRRLMQTSPVSIVAGSQVDEDGISRILTGGPESVGGAHHRTNIGPLLSAYHYSKRNGWILRSRTRLYKRSHVVRVSVMNGPRSCGRATVVFSRTAPWQALSFFDAPSTSPELLTVRGNVKRSDDPKNFAQLADYHRIYSG